MKGITPRGEEVRRVVEILEDPQYDSAEAHAKAIIKEVADILFMREWWALSHRPVVGEGSGLNWGPYPSVIEAQKAAERHIGFGEARAVKLYSAGQLEAKAEGKKWKGYCKTCGHAPYLHTFDGSSRGKCGLSKCSCEKWQEEKK